MRLSLFVAVSCLVALCVAGCSRSDGRQSVRGTVELDGQPLKLGSISFRPIEGHTANSAGGTIRDGEFRIPAAHGLLPGKFHVTVQAFKPTGRVFNDPQLGARDELAPVQFRETDLEATVLTGRGNRFDFQLTAAE